MVRPGAVHAMAALAAAVTTALLVAATHASPPPDADVIIIGGGTAGCVLAARLCAALPRVRVLLLERGAPRNATEELLVRSPRLVAGSWATPSVAAAFPSAANAGLRGRPVALVTGATLGGSSAVNAAQWSEPADDGAGAAAWGVAHLTATAAARAYARAAATLGVRVPPRGLRHEYLADWVAAAAAAGLPRVTDAGGGAPQPRRGVWLQRLAIDGRGRRVDAGRAYVAPAARGACARNLVVRQGVTVARVVLAPRHGRGGGRRGGLVGVVGVEVVPTASAGDGRPPRTTTLRARLGVITAAGPYGSAPLLLRSGIGRPQALRSAGVRPVVDLPVGEGLLARSVGRVVGAYDGVPLAAVNNATLLADPATLRRWRAGRGGPLGAALSVGLGRVTTGEGAYFPAGFASSVPGKPDYNSGCLANPTSRGRLSLPAGAAATDPLTPPRVETNLLGNRRDVATLLACMRKLQAVVGGFRPAFGMTETVPGADTRLTEELVRRTATSGAHLVGGCSVGRVLEATLRVKGVGNLWVVDASALPAMPRSAGPMASVYMLAEHASEAFIRQFRGQ